MVRSTEAGVLSAFALLALASAPRAATLHVPAGFPFIQAALDAAQSGDEVLVAPGTWTQATSRTLVFADESLTLTAVAFVPAGVALVSETGSDATTIRIEGVGTDGHAVVAALTGSTDAILVRGFRFERQFAGAPAVLLRENPEGAMVEIDECVFASMQGPLNEGAGLWSVNGGGLTVSRCLFDDVDNPTDCGTLWCRGAIGYYEGPSLSHSVRVTDTEFRGCDGGGIRCKTFDFAAERCTFTDCTSASTGSGIRAEAVTVLVEDCAFVDCADTPLQVRWRDATIRRCRFIGGSGDLSGGISSTAERTTVDDCVFEDCVGGWVGAIRLGPTFRFPSWIRGNLFRGIESGTFAAYYQNSAVIGTLEANTFVDCTSTGSSSAACAYITPNQHEITSMVGNIFAGSNGSRPAVRVTAHSTGTLETGCNLYWDNAGGDASGFVPAESAVFADPLFCDASAGNYHLQWGSPCLPANSGECGLIGRFGFGGCNSISVQPETWARIKARWRE